MENHREGRLGRTLTGLTSKRHVFSTGRTQGGCPFSRGQIYHILRNPTYLGRIRHKDKSFPGQHEAIIKQDQWDRVQSRLEAAAMRRRGGVGPAPNMSATLTAPLLGKIRDETGDLLTPSHTTKGRQRHRYYVSNRLISGRPDPAGWRLPAIRLEKAVAHAISKHLREAAGRHQIVTSQDALLSTAAVEAVNALIETVEAGGIRLASRFLLSGKIEGSRLHLQLAEDAIAKQLGIPQADLSEGLCHFGVPFTIRRRGVEMKIIAGDLAATPDATLIRALRNAHDWVNQMKAGASIRAVAAKAGMSESYVARLIPLAFLSPQIQQAILQGNQPVEMTLETLVHTKLSMEWSAQASQLGFSQIP